MRYKGLYRFQVPAWRIRRTKFWTQAELDYAAEEFEKLVHIWREEKARLQNDGSLPRYRLDTPEQTV